MKTLPFKTGKLPARHDERTLKFAEFLRAPVKLPAEYSVDKAFPGCRPRMYLNDTYGDCVMACQAEIQDRLVLQETGKPAKITDAEVRKQYFKETGGTDSGLNLLDALKAWMKPGWVAGGKPRKLGAFLSVNWRNSTELKTAIIAHRGLMCGVQLPEDAMSEFMHGKPWTSTKYAADPEEGHCIMASGWTKAGITFITWAGYITASIEWVQKYMDEAYNPFDRIKKLDHAMVDVHGLRERLENLP